jgi:hypothetical protein
MLAEQVRQLVEALSRQDQDGAEMRPSEGTLAVVESLVSKLRLRQTSLAPAGAGAGQAGFASICPEVGLRVQQSR